MRVWKEGILPVDVSETSTSTLEERPATLQEQKSDEIVNAEHSHPSETDIFTKLQNKWLYWMGRTLPEMIKKEFKDWNLVDIIRQEIMHQNISPIVQNKENAKFEEQVSALTARMDKMNHTLCSLQQEVRFNINQTQLQIKELSEITFRNNDRIAVIESDVQDLHNRLAIVEQRVGKEKEWVLQQQKVAAIVSQRNNRWQNCSL